MTSSDRCWLVCPHCHAKELVQAETEFGACPNCGGGPRHAEDDNGTPMFVWSTQNDPTSWSVDPADRATGLINLTVPTSHSHFFEDGQEVWVGGEKCIYRKGKAEFERK